MFDLLQCHPSVAFGKPWQSRTKRRGQFGEQLGRWISPAQFNFREVTRGDPGLLAKGLQGQSPLVAKFTDAISKRVHRVNLVKSEDSREEDSRGRGASVRIRG